MHGTREKHFKDVGTIKRSASDIELKLKVIKGKLKTLAWCDDDNKSLVALYKSLHKLSNQNFDEVKEKLRVSKRTKVVIIDAQSGNKMLITMCLRCSINHTTARSNSFKCKSAALILISINTSSGGCAPSQEVTSCII